MLNLLLTGYHINPINAAIIAITIPTVAVIAAKLRLEEWHKHIFVFIKNFKHIRYSKLLH
jgi:hypothetical protein